ncbi:MAG: serine/threonine protein kinase, partial [Myxococcales bacterium]|nr:serine/threonine protein kinase [Myxococcales bacterium]
MEVFGKFELLTRLARGGMAEVFLARQRGDGRFERLVVIKRVLPHLAEDERFIELFLEEARIAALLDHPNIVPIYDLGRVDVLGAGAGASDETLPSYFLAMPYIHGVTVQTLGHESDARGVRLSLGDTCTIIRQALGGLCYAFEHRGLDGLPLRVVHRDVTPSNLMVNDQGRVQVLDFGIATVHDSDLATGSSRRGKVTYMSPEQVRSEELDCRSDLFSLAVIFWELLTYKRLFKADSDLQTLRTIVEGPYPDVREEAPEVPEAIADVVRGALQREREARFADARSMRNALDAAMRRCGIEASVEALGARVREVVGDVLADRQQLVDRANAGQLSSEQPTRVEVPAGPSGGSRRSRASGSLGTRGHAARRRRRRRLVALLAGALLLVGGGITAA